jgi:single-strand DNA-binding protein
MAGETVITVIGNLTDDPELRFTPSGAAVANFTVASTPRTFDKNSNEWKDGDALFLRCSIWRQSAENVAESLTRGMRVIVSGRLRQRSYETKEGEKRTVVELEVEEIGPSLKYATAKVTKANRPGGGGAPGGGGWGANSGGGQGGGGQQAGGWSGNSGGGQQGGSGVGSGGWGANSGGQSSGGQSGGGQQGGDPWASGGGEGGWGGGSDEPPF